jgi:hypothetical protein
VQQFTTVHEAKEYLIGRILEQASKDGVSLTDIERKMLYFSESGWTLPDMMAVSSEFDRNCSQDEYEKKIAEIVQHIHKGNEGDSGWNNAVNTLRSEDHYLLVLIGRAPSRPAPRPPGDIPRLILAACLVVAVLFAAMSLVNSHVASRASSRPILYAVFAAALAAAMLFNRRR